jgi:hypothetical protein
MPAVRDPVTMDRRLFLVARLLLAMSVGLSFVSAFYLTLELDEAWISGPTRQWVGGTLEIPNLNPVLTSGGLHFVLQALTSLITDNEHYLFRIISVGYFVLLAFILSTLFDVTKEVRNGSLILLATVLSVPGVLLHCTLAFSTVLAIGMLFVTLGMWIHYPVGSAQRRLFAGILLGMTVATRFNMLPAIPVLLAFSLGSREDRRAQFTDGILISLIAVATLLCSHTLQVLISNTSHGLADSFWLTLKVSGIWDKSALTGNPQAAGDGIWPYLQLWVWLDRWQLATQQFPLWIMLVGSAYAWAPLGRFRSPRDTTILKFVAAFSWVSWLSWLILSPLPWYRYFLPALIGFAVIFGHLMIVIYRMVLEHKRDIAFIVPIFVVANLLNSTVIGVRHLRLGDSARIVREYSGVANLANNQYAAFAAEDHQRSLVEFIREMSDAGDSIAVAGREFEQLPLAFRARRSVTMLEDETTDPSNPLWVIVPPGGMNDEARLLLGSRYQLSRWIGPYAILRDAQNLGSR